MKLIFLPAVFLFGLVSCSHAEASLVTEVFSGSGAVVTPGNTGNIAALTVAFPDTSGCADISFDVTVESINSGSLHADARGFGAANGNDALNGTEQLRFTLSAPTITTSASAPAGSTVVSNNLTFGFTQFDLVNNGTTPPGIGWTDNLGGMGTTTAAAGTGSGSVTVVTGFTSGATVIDASPSNSGFLWLDNIQFEYSGEVVIDKPDTVPEPGSLGMLALATLALTARRRRIQ